jgi:hypothetical protein
MAKKDFISGGKIVDRENRDQKGYASVNTFNGEQSENSQNGMKTEVKNANASGQGSLEKGDEGQLDEISGHNE